MRHNRIWAVALTLALAAIVAPARGGGTGQPYSVKQVSGHYATPPSSVTKLNLSSSGSSVVSLPFTFSYFGVKYTNLQVHAGGFVVFGTVSLQSGAKACAPYRTGLDPSTGGYIAHWTEGTTGNRVFKVAWEQLVGASGLGLATFQLHLYEGSDTVVFAYGPRGNPDTWSSFGGFVSSLSVRMDATAASDKRFVVPDPSLIIGHPGTDFEMSPTVTTYTGRLLYDELVTDADGIGSSVRPGVPLAGLRAGLFDSAGELVASDVIAADGAFSVTGLALDGNASGSLGIVLENDAARIVSTPGGTTDAITSFYAVDFSLDEDIGTFTFGSKEDEDGSVRSLFHTALIVQKARDWAKSRTSDTISLLDVVVDDDSGTRTGYVPAQDGGTPAHLIVSAANTSSGGAGAPSSTGSHAPDTWDADVIVRTYGRHILGAIATDPTTNSDDAFDKVTDDENAFAVGFAHYLAAIVNGRGEFIDGIDDETAAVIDLEDPDITSRDGPDVAGRIAGGLYDLVDPANEDHDGIDGTGVEDRAFQVVDSLSSPVTVASFIEAWAQAGYDAAALSRIFITSRALVDDDDERNDNSAERVSFGAIGVCIRDHVLNVYNDDWFEIELPDPAPTLELTFHVKELVGTARVTLTLLDEFATVLAANSDDVGRGDLVQLSAGPLSAGTYQLSVRHDMGNAITLYALQAHLPFATEVPDLPDWTVGRPYLQPFALGGGVSPYECRVLAPDVLPPGLVIDGPNQRVTGTPLEAGEFEFDLEMGDAGDPENRELSRQSVVINPPLSFEVGSIVAFPLGRAHDLRPERIGGTAPFVFGISSGALPSGIELLPDDLRFTGTADAVGSVDFDLDGEDVAGSAHSGSARAVVTMPVDGKKSPADLLAGDQATGWFFDAVAGSRVNFTVKTGKKRTKRMLFEPVVLGPSGHPVEGGKRKAGKGKASAKKVSLPASGRYFLITGSTDGESTQLVGTTKVAAPKRLKGKLADIQRGELAELTFGALPGARLRFKANVGKRADLNLRVLALMDPDGNEISVNDKVTSNDTMLKLDTELAVGGTWTILLQATADQAADVSWSVKLKQPKGVAYSTD